MTDSNRTDPPTIVNINPATPGVVGEPPAMPTTPAEPAAQVDAPPTDAPPSPPPAPPPPPQPSPSAPRMEPVPFVPRDTAEMHRLAGFLSRSTLIPKDLIGKPDNVFLVLFKGHSLGLEPMQSIGNLHIIEGKVELSALLMVSLILKSGLCEYWRLVHSDRESATYETKRIGSEHPVTFTYDIEEAREMGLLDKGKTDWAKENNQWKRQPRTMLRRRAQSNLAREVYPDVIMGMYDIDELREQRELEEERMIRMGIDPRSIVNREDVVEMPVAPALAAPSETPSAFKQAIDNSTVSVAEVVAAKPKKADPLKERLAKRKDGPLFGVGEIACAGCGVPIVGKLGDRCEACKTS